MAVAIAAALLCIAGGAPARVAAQTAPAGPPTSAGAVGQAVVSLQERGRREIDRRLATLASLQAVVDGARRLTGEHKSVLAAQVRSAGDGLRSLRDEVAATTDEGQAREAVALIRTRFQIYGLLEPRTGLVLVADADADAAARLLTIATRLERAASDAGPSLRRPDAVRAAVESVRAHAGAAAAGAAEIAPSVVSLTPADQRASTVALLRARDALRRARADLRASIAAARTAAADLPTA